ncbi:Protein FAM84A [Heterocephalus glaber]|uniref:Protein FAM84A n=1 Tax=Heterocephalus glaber TaxID=10181 RepID=G5AQ63_HETGA|nr:Protein FAM84A [Heterocephalus glaber]
MHLLPAHHRCPTLVCTHGLQKNLYGGQEWKGEVDDGDCLPQDRHLQFKCSSVPRRCVKPGSMDSPSGSDGTLLEAARIGAQSTPCMAHQSAARTIKREAKVEEEEKEEQEKEEGKKEKEEDEEKGKEEEEEEEGNRRKRRRGGRVELRPSRCRRERTGTAPRGRAEPQPLGPPGTHVHRGVCSTHGNLETLKEFGVSGAGKSRIPVPGPRLAASLMGNQLDRITHLSYSELPTGDPSGIEKDELRVGVAYFFSDEEEDLDERGQPDKFCVKATAGCTPCPESPSRHHHHLLHQLVLNETQVSAFRGQECIFSKVSGGPQGADLSVYAVTALPALCEPGDLLELLWLQPAPAGEIRQDSLYEAGAANVGRVVNSWYRYRPLVAELVLQNACGHLGLKSEEICWTNSESFAAWCRFGKREFKAGGEVQAGTQPPQQQYCLKVHLGENKVSRRCPPGSGLSYFLLPVACTRKQTPPPPAFAQ